MGEIQSLQENKEKINLPPLETAGLTVFILVLFIGIFSTLFGFPGTIIILLASVIFAALTGFAKLGFKIILVLAMLSFAAEMLDFYLGVRGAARFGASKKGVVASVIGGVAGAILMTPFFFGLGTLMGAFFGGFAGTLTVELLRQKHLKPAMRASYGAVLGRMAGLMAKGGCAMAMTIMVLYNIYS
jgi:hypothetical protein